MNRLYQVYAGTAVSALLAAALIAAQAPGAFAQDDISRQRSHTQGGPPLNRRLRNGYQQWYISNGIKYYWYNGQEWSLNLALGKRRLLIETNSYSTSSATAQYTYYTYRGNHYVIDRRTGSRRMLH
jgi:hypothetical protein